jgi:hypothetical protein
VELALVRYDMVCHGMTWYDVAMVWHSLVWYGMVQGSNFIAAIAAIAVEGEQNAVDHCGNDGNLLPYSAIFILFTVHYNNYFDT